MLHGKTITLWLARIFIVFIITLLVSPSFAESPYSGNPFDEKWEPRMDMYVGYSVFSEEQTYLGETAPGAATYAGGDLNIYSLGVIADLAHDRRLSKDPGREFNTMRLILELSGGDNNAVDHMFGYKAAFETGWRYAWTPSFRIEPYVGFWHDYKSVQRHSDDMGLSINNEDGSWTAMHNQEITLNRAVSSIRPGIILDYFFTPRSSFNVNAGAVVPFNIDDTIPRSVETSSDRYLIQRLDAFMPAVFVTAGFTYKACGLFFTYEELRTETTEKDADGETVEFKNQTMGCQFRYTF